MTTTTKNQKAMFRSKMTRFKNASRDYNGLWFPKVVHPKTVTTEDIMSEIPKDCSLKRNDLLVALTELSEFLPFYFTYIRQGLNGIA
jgi:hypothetical protein